MTATDAVRFDDDGLVPCVMQDAHTGEVLTLAYMNAEALERTLATREIHFWSRSRGELWHKGATSGNTQRLVQLRYDCDGDAARRPGRARRPRLPHRRAQLLPPRPRGRARRGRASSLVPAEALAALERTLADRAAARPEGSYTVELLDDPERIGEKIREEADEVARAIAGESDERVAEESADVLYHLEVGLTSRGLSLARALEVLNARRR